MKTFIKSIYALKTLLLLLCLPVLFTGCGKNNTQTEGNSNNSSNGKLSVVTTIFPYYDFTRQIAGDKADIKLIVPAGMDTHSFEPVASDMINIGKADIIIYNGGEMEGWTSQVLEASSNKNIIEEKMMDYVETVIEEDVTGLHKGHNHSSETEDSGEAGEIDEHIWTSPVNAIKIVSKIADILSRADKDNKEYYQENASKYISKLKEIDNEFREIVNSSSKKHLLFADRFPLRYFVDEYGLDYNAAFAGCSSETEPSADIIAFLTDKAIDENIHVILKVELTSPKVADAIAETTGAKVMTFNTCHNVTKEQFDNGVT
ncbi:MAG: metal ABC transporter substrate-binding protein, partial [Lachnospiraceae bacterium]|nr:metal ABC transporter substrate-binding protein [Lachnospiraceae bacterium]